MTDQTVDARSFRWKRLFVVSVGITTGITLATLAIVIAALLYPLRPVNLPPWNKDQITTKFVGLSLSTGESLVVTFQYTVENHTGHDYELPSSVNIYKALADGKGLERDVTLKWSGGTSLPAEQKMNVSIEIEYKYTETYSYTERESTEKLAAFMNRRLSEIDGFTVLDKTNRYEIRFPKPPDFKS